MEEFLVACRDGKVKLFKDKQEFFIPDEIILNYLNDRIILEEGFTLRDYFYLVSNYENLKKLDSFFEDFLKEVESCPKDGCKSDEINNICISKIIEIDTLYEDNPKINSYVDVSGDSASNPKEHLAIELTPLSRLLDHPIKFDHALLDKTTRREAECEKFEYDYSLYDLIKEIIWELSFVGSPSERDIFKENLDEKVKEISKEFEKQTGE